MSNEANDKPRLLNPERVLSIPVKKSDPVFRDYRRAYYLIRLDSAAYKHVSSYDPTWITHLYQKTVFFQAEFIQRRSSILTEEYSLVQSCSLDHDAESVTGKLVRGICCMTSLFQSCPPDLDAESVTEKLFEKICKHEYVKQQRIPYLDLLF
ncbi:hypothetical protein PIB30_056076 [Stylosanthes scabra]|uniref:Uncharacterized protein n=1 Tax=Stylosanthes scabra TaxID=79078 RepID=A0ABU6RJ66_9FABA|nr:hypothetical protein [Stylosanthes scabra]